MLTRLLSVVAAFAVGAALAQEAPDAMVKKTIDEVLTIVKTDKDLQSGNQAKIVSLAEEKVLPKFDFTRMTRLAMGRNWNQANDAQKADLTKEFRTLLVRTYSSALGQYRNQTIDVKPLKATPSDSEVIVKTVVNQGSGPQIPIDYNMAKADEGWKVYDILVDGVSLVTNYRSTFNDEISRSGVDGLIKSLRERNASAAKKS